MRRASMPRKIGKAALFLVVAVLVVHSILLVVWGRQLQQSLAELRARGEPVAVSDLPAKPIPDAENAAVMYAHAFELFQKKAKPDWSLDRALGEYSSAKTGDTRAKLEPSARDAVRRFQLVLPLIEKAQRRPRCVFADTDWGNGVSPRFPCIPHLRELSRLISAEAFLEATDGNLGLSLDAVVLHLHLGEALREDPRSMYAQVVRMYLVRRSVGLLNDVTNERPVSYLQAKRLYDEFGRVSFTPEFLRAVHGETAELNSYFDASRKDMTAFLRSTGWGNPGYRITPITRPWPPDRVDMQSPEPGRLTRIADRLASYLWRPISYKDQQAYLESRQRYLRLDRLPYKDFIKAWRDAGKTQLPRWAVLTHMPTAGFPTGNAWKLRDVGVAHRGLAEVAMALKAYQSRFGSYPVSLNQLKSQLGWPLPDDPFSGKPFVYKRSGQGFVIYSLGPDLKDNNGMAATTNEYIGDLVWSWKK